MDWSINKKCPSFFYYIIITIIAFSIIILFISNNNKKKELNLNTVNFKLIAITHTSLPWEFKPVNSSLEIRIGEVTNIEYLVKNLSDKKTSGIATFAYYPRELEVYISKIQCFCYEIKTLKPKEEEKYTLTMMIDPKATKDNKTKSIKEATIQFIFFDSKNFKENKD